MRIGVLEWASCGGTADSAQPAESIRVEGWTMCRAALLSLAQAGHQAVALVDRQSAIDSLVRGYRTDQLELIELSAGEDIWSQWQRVYSSCDATLVIAPEHNHILAKLLNWCQRSQVRTCNCCETFVVRASDKYQTAQLLQAHGVPHPRTQLLADMQSQWLTGASSQSAEVSDDVDPAWVLKPRDGVGCDGLRRIASHDIRNHEKYDPSRWIVQPWIRGDAYSRAAIVDRSGHLHWLPVTRQHLVVSDQATYLGGRVEPDFAKSLSGLDLPLAGAIGALGGKPCGWVGVDFLYDAANLRQPITVIEINPRLTTSFVGLASAGAPHLAAAIVAAALGRNFSLPSHWQEVHFSVSGGITVV